MTFAERVRSRRIELCLNQTNVALLMNVAPQFISNIEFSRAKLPFSRVESLAEALNLPTEVVVNWLIEDFKERLFQGINKNRETALANHFNDENNFDLEAT